MLTRCQLRCVWQCLTNIESSSIGVGIRYFWLVVMAVLLVAVGPFMFVANGQTLLANISVGGDPNGIVVNSATNIVYVANYSTGNVSVINAADSTVLNTISVGTNPWAIAVNPIQTQYMSLTRAATV